jgi:3-oxoacyl-[acyl-carrier protein] reductase
LRALGIAVAEWDMYRGSLGPDQFSVDVTDEDSVAAAWSSTVAAGPVTGLVCGAAVWDRVSLEESTLSRWNRTIDVNLTGCYLSTKAVWDHFAANQGGHIVLIASIAGIRPPRVPSPAYAASKAGVIALGRSLASEGAKHGIRCNMVAPGAVDTKMLTSVLSDEELAGYESQAALGRLARPDEIAEVISAVLDVQTPFLSGAFIEVTGG